MCVYCGYGTQPGYPGDVHVDCAKKRIAELEAAALDAAEQLERGVFSRDAIALRLRTVLGADRN